jgi:hypothetical protein
MRGRGNWYGRCGRWLANTYHTRSVRRCLRHVECSADNIVVTAATKTPKPFHGSIKNTFYHRFSLRTIHVAQLQSVLGILCDLPKLVNLNEIKKINIAYEHKFSELYLYRKYRSVTVVSWVPCEVCRTRWWGTGEQSPCASAVPFIIRCQYLTVVPSALVINYVSTYMMIRWIKIYNYLFSRIPLDSASSFHFVIHVWLRWLQSKQLMPLLSCLQSNKFR